jgi:xanthine dehydrogenase YagR molybdenum-binding subunit
MADRPLAVIGKERARVDGPLKVTGRAMYTSDYSFPGMLYAVPVGSTIANGDVVRIDAAAAEAMPGVRAIFHRGNLDRIFRATPRFSARTDAGFLDEPRPPFEDDVVRYHGQYVALAVADTFEQAKAAADAVRVEYRVRKPDVGHELEPDGEPEVQSERGDAAAAFASAPVKIDATYDMAAETHNPIELHATVALWEGAVCTLYETTQGVVNHRNVIAQMLGVPRENVRVISKFLGSGFGCKLFPWTHSALAAAAARRLQRPVKLVLSRKMMFQTVGHRPRIVQRMRLGATAEGRLTSLRHEYVNHTSILDDYAENCGEATAHLYSCPNLRVTSALAHRHVGTPTSMRGPGAVPGLFALESAMDELAIALNMDPLAFRLANEPELDEGRRLPFTSRHLRECYTIGAEKFGWARRDPAVGSMKRDGLVLGWGMAACSWLAERFASDAAVELRDDGTARVSVATQDIGTGTYTVLAQLAAEKLEIPIEKVEVELGDSALPPGPISGGSMATSSLVPAVFEAAQQAVDALLANAKRVGMDGELRYAAGRVHAGGGGGTPFAAVLRRANVRSVAGTGRADGTFQVEGAKVSSHSFGAHFVEVTWQPATARLRVSRMVSVIDAGRILNPLAARNQIEGSLVMGIGMAFLEETAYDPRTGAPANASLADYVVAVNADVPKLEVHFLEYPDLHQNALGARGVGEIGLAGTAAALANAVYHATGFRGRELPIKIEHLIG